MMDYYKCENCGKIFDEFEMDYRRSQIDKKCLCKDCRNDLDIFSDDDAELRIMDFEDQ